MTAMLCTMFGDKKVLPWNAFSKPFLLLSRNLLKMMYFCIFIFHINTIAI